MQPDGATPVLVGIVARAHGLRGEVVVDPTTDTPGRFDPGRVLAAGLPSGAARTLKVATSRPFQGRWLVRFEGVENRTDAEALHSAELTIRRDQVAPLPEGRFYRFELVGLTALTPEGTLLGRIEEVFATGSNDVLVVKGEKGEILIPLLDTVLQSVDAAGGKIVLAPPRGLPGLPGEE
ncbi:MAG TPA: ribosome maturation factor RimM [Candidatus Eisenbacteria bacterium]